MTRFPYKETMTRKAVSETKGLGYSLVVDNVLMEAFIGKVTTNITENDNPYEGAPTLRVDTNVYTTIEVSLAGRHYIASTPALMINKMHPSNQLFDKIPLIDSAFAKTPVQTKVLTEFSKFIRDAVADFINSNRDYLE